ncbi:putative hypothetical protein [Clostridium botulinum BKT015925]|nr:putative hypothetical protein [Clostridium botulinum BKT015925]
MKNLLISLILVFIKGKCICPVKISMPPFKKYIIDKDIIIHLLMSM